MPYEIQTDVLVVGGGAAGLRAALSAADAGSQVLVVLKDRVSRSGITPLASDGIAAAINEDDTVKDYYEASYKIGQGLADTDFIYTLTNDATDRIRELENYSAVFRKDEQGKYYHPKRAKGRDGYSCFINGGGFQITRVLGKQAHKHPRIRIAEDVFVLSLVCNDNQVFGAICLEKYSKKIGIIKAKAIILCTGGYEELWRYTDTSTDSTGDGVMLAYRAGAELIDLEMIQFHPTICIWPAEAKGNFIAYDLFNSDMLNAKALNGKLEVFCDTPTEIKSFVRKSYLEIVTGHPSEHGGYYYRPQPQSDMDEVRKRVKQRMGKRYDHLMRMGVDIVKDTLEMAPSAHYCFGGIRIDINCATSVSGLYAAGECSGNIHGAGRLFSNALTETQVFGYRSGITAAAFASSAQSTKASLFTEQAARIESQLNAYAESNYYDFLKIRNRLQESLWLNCGAVRHEINLSACQAELEQLSRTVSKRLPLETKKKAPADLRDAYETVAMLELSTLLIRSAKARKESRGFHFRSDFPTPMPTAQHICLKKQAEEPLVYFRPVK